MENRLLRSGALCPLFLRSSAPLLLCSSASVLYSHRFFGVGWTVAGAHLRFQTQDLRFQTGRERKVRTPQGNGLANSQAG